MQKRPINFWKRPANNFFAVLLFFAAVLGGCSVDDKALIEKTLDAREKAMNTQNIDAYMSLVSKDYKYKAGADKTVREFMEENLLFWDQVHIRTYNRLITVEGKYGKVIQDYQMSVTKNEKTQVFSGAEHFVLRKEGLFGTKWLFLEGLGGG